MNDERPRKMNKSRGFWWLRLLAVLVLLAGIWAWALLDVSGEVVVALFFISFLLSLYGLVAPGGATHDS